MIYFTAHTFKCVCHCRRAMFRVLGMYNFGLGLNVEVEIKILNCIYCVAPQKSFTIHEHQRNILKAILKALSSVRTYQTSITMSLSFKFVSLDKFCKQEATWYVILTYMNCKNHIEKDLVQTKILKQVKWVK